MTAEELWSKHFDGLHWDDITQEKEVLFAKEYARLKCEELIKIVAEKAEVEHDWNTSYVDRDSILNAVDLNEFIK